MRQSFFGPWVGTVVASLVLMGWGGAGPASGQERATYRHPVGFSVTYPAGWRIQESDEGVVFVPGDAAADAMGQPLELFILGSDDAPGLTDPADPAIVAYFQQNMPGFQMVGSPQRMDTDMGPGAVLTFEGSMGGPPLRQRTYVTVRDGKGVYLAHLATADLAARRDAVAREVFQSFAWGEAQVDPAVFGSWLQEGGSDSEGYGGGYASSGRTRQYWFRPDGTVQNFHRQR